MSQPHEAETGDAGGAVARLVLAARAGDREAFGRLYERFASFVHGVLLANSPADDVADLLQEVFLTALERLHDLRDPTAFGAWTAAIARNAARMSRRRSVRLVPLDADIPAPPGSEPGLDGATVLAAIRLLPEAYRETLLLRLVEGMSGAEIAAGTGLTPGSVRVNLHRGMALLRQRLGGPA